MRFSLIPLSESDKEGIIFMYFQKLDCAIDDYYRKVVLAEASAYEVALDSQKIGFCMIDENQTLVLWDFHDEAMTHAQAWMEEMLKDLRFHSALVSTRQSRFLSLSLEFQESIEVESYLFDMQAALPVVGCPLEDAWFSEAEEKDLEGCKAIVGEPYEGYLKELQNNHGVYAIYQSDRVICMGELRQNTILPRFADLGMATHNDFRGKGLATCMVSRLLEEARQRGLNANAACNFDNLASKRTLEKAGMMATHRMLRIGLNRLKASRE